MQLTEEAIQEIVAIKSIFENQFTFFDKSGFGVFKVEIDLPPYYYIRTNQNEEFLIKYLPPLELYFQPGKSYPDTAPGFCLTCCWLTHRQLSRLCGKLDELWSPGQVVLHEWNNWLKTETLSYLNLDSCLDLSDLMKMREKLHFGLSKTPEPPDNISSMFPLPTSSGITDSRSLDMRALTDIPLETTLKTYLTAFSKNMDTKVFHRSVFICQICFDSKTGLHFTRFSPCNHLFCKECCKTHFETHIKDGDVKNLCCPAPDCTATAQANQVQDLVSNELFLRYDKLLLNLTLDTMEDVVVCPHKNCGIAMVVDLDSSMATCPTCSSTFCTLCKRTYHGLEPCKLNPHEKQKLAKLYQTGSAEEKTQLERTYGKKTLKALVEECLSEEFISANSKKCPKCSANISKEHGCNMMSCSKCTTRFCWLCMVVLEAENPYRHFNEAGGPCYKQLFYGVHMDEDGEEEAWQLGEFL